MDKTLAQLAHEIEAALELTDDLRAKAASAIEAKFEDFDPATDFDSTDAVLGLVRRGLPGWTIQLKGTATHPNGHWHCSLRRSDIRDNDPYVGIGAGPTLPHALLGALIGALAQA
ncbi:hypothetical protein [Alexandriicola marinus]|uniref:hypothetical protein n=1 Tax=Alexandriicola marinus TaxID=2081710 RepID=UPI001EEEB27C|nr:hypothetical protein [Alexandriicola marinus]